MDRVGEREGAKGACTAGASWSRSGHQPAEDIRPELMRGPTKNQIGDRVPGQSRGILDLLEKDQSRDLGLREHRVRCTHIREVVQPPSSQSGVRSYYQDAVSERLLDVFNQELKREIQSHLSQEIERQIQDQLQMYVEQEIERQILLQIMDADVILEDS